MLEKILYEIAMPLLATLGLFYLLASFFTPKIGKVVFALDKRFENLRMKERRWPIYAIAFGLGVVLIFLPLWYTSGLFMDYFSKRDAITRNDTQLKILRELRSDIANIENLTLNDVQDRLGRFDVLITELIIDAEKKKQLVDALRSNAQQIANDTEKQREVYDELSRLSDNAIGAVLEANKKEENKNWWYATIGGQLLAFMLGVISSIVATRLYDRPPTLWSRFLDMVSIKKTD